jgi:imidazolonepropionase-like amidohydrolase
MSPIEAIQPATIVGAELLQVGDETEPSKPGFEADLIALEGYPLKDVRVIFQATGRMFWLSSTMGASG